jgi:hypothetical protein
MKKRMRKKGGNWKENGRIKNKELVKAGVLVDIRKYAPSPVWC